MEETAWRSVIDVECAFNDSCYNMTDLSLTIATKPLAFFMCVGCPGTRGATCTKICAM